MSAILAQFGVEAGSLASQLGHAAYPETVKGRVAHIDADFMAYQVSAESEDELNGKKPRRTLDDMKYNAGEAANHLRLLCGAETYVCHVTPSGSDKGGRAPLAIQKEYQANRADKEKPEHLDIIRAFIGTELNGMVHLDQEADDGMAQANYNAKERHLSIIVSKDKDLRMVPGLHWDFDTETIVDVHDHFGHIWIDASKTSKTLKGWGTKFFWAQCLMGDTADNIQGIPMVGGRTKCHFKPTQTYLKSVDQLLLAKTPAHAAGPEKRIAAEEDKTTQCGQVLTYEILKDVKSDKHAFAVVKRAFTELALFHGYEFKHWETDLPVTPTQALLGDMQLLWMRRDKNPNDCVVWLKEQMA